VRAIQELQMEKANSTPPEFVPKYRKSRSFKDLDYQEPLALDHLNKDDSSNFGENREVNVDRMIQNLDFNKIQMGKKKKNSADSSSEESEEEEEDSESPRSSVDPSIGNPLEERKGIDL
jgi:hypothetical protein